VVLTAQDVQSVGVDTKEKIMTMNDMKEKKFYMLCSYKEVGRPVSDDELRDAFYAAVSEAAYFEPVVDEDGEVDQYGYIEDLDEAESRVAKWILGRVSPEIKAIL
tara:strand:+ start:127 stop:441 length:315 start_codon:yes stop_codon:yes gene_type:complete